MSEEINKLVKDQESNINRVRKEKDEHIESLNQELMKVKTLLKEKEDEDSEFFRKNEVRVNEIRHELEEKERL